MWLQLPSFSIVTWHLGHSFVLAAIQLEVSLSSSHFLIHLFNHLHLTGSCQFSPYLKQNWHPHFQRSCLASEYWTFTTWWQSGAGHHFNSRLHWHTNYKIKNDSKSHHDGRFPITPNNYLHYLPTLTKWGWNLQSILNLLHQCFWIYCFSKIIDPLKTWYNKIYKLITYYVIKHQCAYGSTEGQF